MPTASPGSLSPPLEALVDAGTKTKVTETANAYDTRTSGYGCAPDGCEAANTRDGDFSTRWSCMEDLLDGKNCEITYTFEEPQDIVRILIAFYKGDERTRELKVKINGSGQYVINSSGETTEFESFEINADETETLTLEGLDLPGKGWIAITEVDTPLSPFGEHSSEIILPGFGLILGSNGATAEIVQSITMGIVCAGLPGSLVLFTT